MAKVLGFPSAQALTSLQTESQQAGFSKESLTIMTVRQSKSDLSAAIKFYNSALRLAEDPESIPQAISDYKLCLEYDPNHADAAVNLGTIYYEKENFTEAEKYYKLAIEIDPNFVLAHFNLGNTYDELKFYNLSIEAFLTALAINQRYADAHFNLARMYNKIFPSQPNEALKHFRAFIKYSPINENTRAWVTAARDEVRKIIRGSTLSVVRSTSNAAS